MKMRWIAVFVSVLSFLGDGSVEGWGQGPVAPVVRNDGRVMLTNLAAQLPRSGQITLSRLQTLPGSIETVVHDISKTHGVDPSLTRAVIEVESGFSRTAVSPVGALGLMQLMPATGRRFGVSDFFDPQQNIEGGVRYLKFLLDKFQGNLDLTLAAYNAGENRVARLGRIPRIPETENYVRKVREAYTRMSQAPGTHPRIIEPAVLTRADQIHQSVNQRGIRQFSTVGPRR
jgi:hypothetical protein